VILGLNSTLTCFNAASLAFLKKKVPAQAWINRIEVTWVSGPVASMQRSEIEEATAEEMMIVE